MTQRKTTIVIPLATACALLCALANWAPASSAGTSPGQAPASAPREFQPIHFTPWTPRPNLLPQYAPLGQSLNLSLSATVWFWIGPSPLAITTPANPNFNVSGRIAAIAAHPTDANTIYIAAAGGGVWKTTNGGTTWTPLTDTQTTLSMGGIAIARSNPQVIYAGTGEGNNSADNNYGRGILKSTDGGANWTLQTGPGGAFDRLSTAQIAVDPTNANIAYVAMQDFAQNGLCCANTGVYKTTDGGTTWVNTTTAIESSFPWSAVVIDPTTPSTLYAAHGQHSGNAANGVYKSTNSGGNWTLLATAPNGATTGRFALALSPSNSQVLYVTVSNPSMAAFGALLNISRSDNGGTSFTDLTVGTPNYMGGQGWYDTTAIVDPANSAIVYVTGAAGTNSMLRSTNSGAAWTDISTGGAPNNTSPHVDHHGVDFDANGKLLDGDDGGIYRLDNTTIPSWTDLNGNLSTIQFTGIGLHPTNASIVIGGSQDNGTELYTGNIIWTETDGGDGGYAKFSPTNGNRVYHQAPVQSFGNGNFFSRSDDGGNTWAIRTTGMAADNTQNFYAPFSVDPGNGDRVLYGATNVWETTNGGNLWTAIGTPATGGFNSGGNVDAIGIAPTDVNTLYVATGGAFATSSKIFVTTNRGTSWTERDLPAGSARVNDIQVDPNNAQLAYAVVNRFSTNGHVFVTSNGGMTWTNMSGALPNLPVWSIQIDGATTPHTLYIGADNGVYSSTDLGANWARFGIGLPNAQAVQVALNSTLRILGVATHGRGAWEILLPGAPPPTPSPTSTPATPTPTPTATPTPTPTPTATIVPSATPSATPCSATFSQNFDGVVVPALPAGWISTATGVEVAWMTSAISPASAPNDAFAPDVNDVGNTELITPAIAAPASGGILTFQNLFNMESTFDGMVLEISVSGGVYTDIMTAGGSFVAGGYTGTISGTFGSPIAGRMAWTGLSAGTTGAPGYITTTVNLPAAANGQNIQLKWRAATDNSAVAMGVAGVRIDSIALAPTSCAATPTPTPVATPSPTPTPTPTAGPTLLGNISTRLQVETGDNVLIGGFIVTGTQPKRVILRAIGPSLAVPGKLADPTLELRDAAGALIRSDDNWRTGGQEAEIVATGIPPADDLESAIVATLPANGSAYTAIVRGANNGTGVGLVEVYDLDQTVDSTLANISTRGLVQTGDNVLIAGTIVLGQTAQRVLLRAIGPSLALTGKLEDPTLELRDGNGALIRSDDNWRTGGQEAEIIATGIAPMNDLESAIVATLPAAGATYTAILRGVNNTTGIAVVEVYALP